LKELLVRILLDFDQIRDRDRSLDFGKINSIGGETGFRHRIQELRKQNTNRRDTAGTNDSKVRYLPKLKNENADPENKCDLLPFERQIARYEMLCERARTAR
jgi:hypothetical protein